MNTFINITSLSFRDSAGVESGLNGGCKRDLVLMLALASWSPSSQLVIVLSAQRGQALLPSLDSLESLLRLQLRCLSNILIDEK